MRVIRRRGDFGIRVEVTGPRPERPALALARILERPLARNGGMRDPLPSGEMRSRYVTVTVAELLRARIKRNATQRGLCVASYLGMIVERAMQMRPDELDDWVSEEPPLADALKKIETPPPD